MPLRGLIAAAGGMLALLAPAAASATAPSVNLPGGVQAQLSRTLRTSAIAPTRSAAVAVDLASGRVVFSQNADASLVPASNEKLAVTYGALVELGTAYRFHTDVLGAGRQVGEVWQGRLVLKGYGDPTLTTKALDRLAAKLYARGIRVVTGQVVGDASWYDGRLDAPGWIAGFVPYESGPLSALVVNRGWRHGRLARDPALAAAALFDELLRAHGITARGAATGTAAPWSQTLASVRSHRLTRLLHVMDTDSDNFVAEIVLKAIGAEAAGSGSTADGAAVVRRDLASAGVPMVGTRIADGSGLSRLDRVTGNELAALLVLFWRDPSLRDVVQGSLAIAGETGTLEHRLLGPRTRGVVRGKTGTTRLSSALSGYVGSRYAFVLVQNGSPVNWGAAHALQDAFVKRLAALSRREALSSRSR